MKQRRGPQKFRTVPEGTARDTAVYARDSVPGAGRTAARALREGKSSSTPRLYGKHAVMAALTNPDRHSRRLYASKGALADLMADFDIPDDLEVRPTEGPQLDALVRDAPHQGLVLDVDALADVHIEDALAALTGNQPILVLDQVTDPHNVGAILRSAAAFGAGFIVTQDRHSPPETGALAKAASGCLEFVPWVRAVNLSRALEIIAEANYWRIGLDGAAATLLGDATSGARTCLVLGAEGAGLRQNVAAHCDVLAKLPISARVESLNVSNAAAVALYAVGDKGR